MIAGCDAEARVAVHQSCTAPGDSDVREECDGEAGADRHTTDGRDDGFGAVDEVIDKIARLLPNAHQGRIIRNHLFDERKIAAGGEMLTGATHEHSAHVRVRIDAAPHLRKVTMHGGVGRVQVYLIRDDDLEHLRQRRHKLQGRVCRTVAGEVDGIGVGHALFRLPHPEWRVRSPW